MTTYLDFEKPIADLEGKIEELRRMSAQGEAISLEDEVSKLEQKAALLLKDTYSKLTPWQKTQVARHPERPHFLDYIHAVFQDFTQLGGDRSFSDDKAILGGLASFRGRSVMVIGHEKGNDTKSRLKHNFGMAMPDGYRKAVRLMTMAERFNIPVITLVDTSGAYPGLSAEERGQGEAIARSTEMLPDTGCAACLGHHRRRRIGRCCRACHGRPRLHARAFGLFCDLAGRLLFDSGQVQAGCAAELYAAGCSRCHEGDGARPAAVADHRLHHSRASGWRPARVARR
jgi:hypothetical protein